MLESGVGDIPCVPRSGAAIIIILILILIIIIIVIDIMNIIVIIMNINLAGCARGRAGLGGRAGAGERDRFQQRSDLRRVMASCVLPRRRQTRQARQSSDEEARREANRQAVNQVIGASATPRDGTRAKPRGRRQAGQRVVRGASGR